MHIYPDVGPKSMSHSAPGLQREKTGVQMSHYLLARLLPFS